MKTLWITFFLFPLTTLAAEKQIPTTRERAAQMFRAPSSTKPKKIDRKFQPIDHLIKGTSGSSRTEERKNF